MIMPQYDKKRQLDTYIFIILSNEGKLFSKDIAGTLLYHTLIHI